MPKRLLKEKFEINKERHKRDRSKQDMFLNANYNAMEALLADIAEVNRI